MGSEMCIRDSLGIRNKFTEEKIILEGYMIYWIFLIGSFIVLVISLFFIWKKRIKDDDMDNETLGVTIFIACVSLICLITFSLDIPCALRGG